MVQILTYGDFLLLMQSSLFYLLNKGLVRSIIYKPLSDEVEIKHFGTRFLKETCETYNTQDLVKHKGKTINPFIGYKKPNPTGDDLLLATEGGTAQWTERKLFDSIIKQPKSRQPVAAKPAEAQEEKPDNK